MVRINGPVSPILNSLHAWDWEIETTEEYPCYYQIVPLLKLTIMTPILYKLLRVAPRSRMI